MTTGRPHEAVVKAQPERRRKSIAKTELLLLHLSLSLSLVRAQGESAVPRQARPSPSQSDSHRHKSQFYDTFPFGEHASSHRLCIRFFSTRCERTVCRTNLLWLLSSLQSFAAASIVLGLARVLRFKQTFIYKRCIRCKESNVCKERRERGNERRV